MIPEPFFSLPSAPAYVYATCMAALLAIFALRICAQLLVAIWAPEWLPEMRAWQSGAVPYLVLLPTQVAILVAMTFVTIEILGESGSIRVGLGVGRTLVWASYIYLAAMIARTARYLMADRREAKAILPVPFHIALAASCSSLVVGSITTARDVWVTFARR